MSSRILILGGYGAVGREAAAALGEQADVVIAGRRPDSAKPMPGVTVRRVDVGDPASVTAALDDVDVVLMCADSGNAAVARAALTRGIDYLDVSASHRVLSEIEELDDVARHHDATAALSVGLAPGITNLLARHVVEQSGARDVEIGVLLGSGEHHGAAAVAWTIDGLGQLDGSWTMDFPAPYGSRTVHRFPFSDQHTLPATLGVATARTGLALDSRLTTAALAAAGRPAVARFLRRPKVRSVLLAAMGKVHVGGDGFVVTARAGTVHAWFSGRRQSRATGLAAALLIRHLPDLPPGVAHIDQLVEPLPFLTDLVTESGFVLEVDRFSAGAGGRGAG